MSTTGPPRHPAPPMRHIAGVGFQAPGTSHASFRSESTRQPAGRPSGDHPATPRAGHVVVPAPAAAPPPRPIGRVSGAHHPPAPALDVPREVIVEHTDFLNMIGQLGVRPTLQERELVTLAALIFRCSAAEGRVMVAEGQPADHAFFLIVGHAEVSQPGQGRPGAFDVLQPGAFFGEGAMLNEAVHPYTVTAGPGCVLFALSKAALADLWQHDRLLAQRLQAAFAAHQTYRHRQRGW